MAVLDLGIDGFEDCHEIGRGASSRVYRCTQLPFGRTVALKVLAGVGFAKETTTTFTRECKAVGALHWHPNIVTVFGAGVSRGGDPYLAMEFAPGGSLASHVAAVGRMPEELVRAIGAKIASALQAAHDAGVLHRDIKPANILVGEGGEPLLADFGVASVSGATMTNTGPISATLAHAAPEVLNGKRPTVASDVYSLGSTLFTLLAGRAPFASSTDEGAYALITRALTAELPDLRRFGVSDATSTVVERAMERNPELRFASAADLAAALSAPVAADAGAPPSVDGNDVTTVGHAAPTSKGGRRRRKRLVLVALAAVLAAVGTTAGVLATRSSSSSSSSTPTTEPALATLRPAHVRASATSPDGLDDCGDRHPFIPQQAFDGQLDTAWAAPPKLGTTELTLEFDGPVTITSIEIVPGYARNDRCSGGVDRWYQNSRVKEAAYQFSDGSIVNASFDTDKATFQSTAIAHKTTTSLIIRPLALVDPGGPVRLSDRSGPKWASHDLRKKIVISEVHVHGTAVKPATATTH